MTKIAYIFQKITFSCCCLFIKETTLSLINDFQKMLKKKFSKMFKKKMFQNVLVTHRRMIKSILLQNLPLRSNPFAEVIVTSDQAVLIFPFCYSVL